MGAMMCMQLVWLVLQRFMTAMLVWMILLGPLAFDLVVPTVAKAACSNLGGGQWSTNVATLGTCITSAARNDTITVSDSGSIPVSGFTLTKGVTIIGPGRDTLTLTRSGTLFSINPDSTTRSNSHNIKITGFTLGLNGSSNNAINIDAQSNYSESKPYRYVIIGDMRIQNGGSLSEGIHTTCQVRGVAYNIEFININRIQGPRGCDNLNEWFNTAFNQLQF